MKQPQFHLTVVLMSDLHKNYLRKEEQYLDEMVTMSY